MTPAAAPTPDFETIARKIASRHVRADFEEQLKWTRIRHHDLVADVSKALAAAQAASAERIAELERERDDLRHMHHTQIESCEEHTSEMLMRVEEAESALSAQAATNAMLREALTTAYVTDDGQFYECRLCRTMTGSDEAEHHRDTCALSASPSSLKKARAAS